LLANCSLVVAENRSSLERLRSFVETLTETDMGRLLGEGWTVSAALGHLAFWDQRWAEKLQEWERSGVVRIPLPAWHSGEGPPVDVDAVNAAMIPWWRARQFPEVRNDLCLVNRANVSCQPWARSSATR
jgi:hypothetical protein